MKKQSIYALMSAIALAGAVGLSACSSSNDDVINNPDYNPETNTVKTEFTISLPNYFGTKAKTRQTDVITQAQTTPVFRGMQNMVLIPFTSDGTTPLNNKVFNLEAITTWDLANQNAKVYKTLDVPIGTSKFIFYGQATIDGTNFNNGVLNPPAGFTGALSTYNFTLQPIASGYTAAGDTKGTAILNYLKSIRATTGITSSALQSLLTNFKPTAASSASVQFAVDDLWKKVIAGAFTDGDGKDKVKASIEGTGNSTATISDGNNVTLTGSDITGYPANLNLPDGAVSITWTDPANPAINKSDVIDALQLDHLVYPAALYYRANSTIGVSANDNVSTTYGSDAWTTILASNKYTWSGTVGPTTHSIALHDQIQYAVGRFDLSVKAANATLYDADGQTVTVDATDGFPITAVLIGGQKDVGFDFTPNGTISYTIYDNVMNGTMAAKNNDAVGVNRTLVLETAAEAKVVKIAVELTNNTGTAFKGVNGTVPVGGKFYLIGELNLDKTSEITGSRTKIFEQDYITKATFTISQGNAAATPIPGTNTTGLGAAYNVLPDLTISQLEVAFSVDLNWTPGLQFNINF